MCARSTTSRVLAMNRDRSAAEQSTLITSTIQGLAHGDQVTHQ